MKGKVVYLRSSTWKGGGGHWYGKVTTREIEAPEDPLDVRRFIDEESAELLNKSQVDEIGVIDYKAGAISIRFTSHGELVRAAIAMMPGFFPEGKVLVAGEPNVLEPQEVIIGPGKRFVDAANRHWRMAPDKEARRKYANLFRRHGIKLW